MSKKNQETIRDFINRADMRRLAGLKTQTSIGPAGASIVSDDGKRIKNTSGDPNKKLKTLRQLADSLDTPFPQAGVASAIRKGKGKPKEEPKLEEEILLPERKVKGKPNMLDVAGGAKTLNVKKGGLIKKKKKKSKIAGRLAKRGYGAARK